MPRLGHFTPRMTWYPLCRRLGVRQGRSERVQKISLPPGFDTRNVQPVGSRNTDYVQDGLESNVKFKLL